MPEDYDSHQRELLDAAWLDYDNDAPRLAYADWLDTIGDPADSARAECIRRSLSLGPNHWSDPALDAIRRRVAELMKKYKSAWFAGIPSELMKSWQPQINRGLFEIQVLITPQQLQSNGDRWFRRFPPDVMLDLHLQGEQNPRKAARLPPIDWSALMAKPWWERVLELRTWSVPLGADACRALAENPAIRRLRRLSLHGCPIGDEGALALAASPHLGNLRVLEVGGCNLSGASAIPLAERATMPRLQSLFLQENPRIDASAWDTIRQIGGATVKINFNSRHAVYYPPGPGDLPTDGDEIPF